ncbi:MAG: phospholipase D family protein [Burkholderiaceae bacterium]|nr:phospholipase D family protein [Burkholderiaceae bacterium]
MHAQHAGPQRRWQRLRAGLEPTRITALLATLAALWLMAGCASLPAAPARTPSWARAALPPQALLGETAAAPAAGLSGFHLVPDGAQALRARLDLVRRAQSSLDLQCYHLQDDDSGRSLLRALRDAAARGVRVRLLLDDLYTAGQDRLLLGLAAHPGVELRLFNPFPAGRDSLARRFAASLADLGRVHRRMHNKLMVVDGVVAVVGGRNIADEYFMRRPGDNFIDIDTLVIGAVLPRLAAQFDRYWNSRHAWPIETIATAAAAGVGAAALRQQFDQHMAASAMPNAEGVAAGLPPGEPPAWVWAPAEAYADDPDKILGDESPQDAAAPLDTQGIRHRLVERIRSATHEVQVASPYVVPTRRSIDTVELLRRRGVQMTVLTNSLAATDEPMVHASYGSYRQALLRQGVKVYELDPLRVPETLRMARIGPAVGRLHAKLVVVDGQTLFIGSFNFDPRSATHNTELGLLVHSPELAAQALALLGQLQQQGAYRLQLRADGRGIDWLARAADGREQRHEEPDPGWWRRLLLRLIGPFVPVDLL